MRTLTSLPLAAPADVKRPADKHARMHESAIKHVTGRAAYIDDLKAPADTLHIALGLSTVAHGRLSHLDLPRIRLLPGVVDAVGVADVPGHTDIGPVFPGDPVLVESEISYAGQILFAVAAETYRGAREAVKAAFDAGMIRVDADTPSLD
ncbi:MAG: xanthine dehydrogenase molybdopterin binding subunit, partial [Halomonas sp.]